MGFRERYEKALIAHGYAMGRSAKEIEEHISHGKHHLVVYQLVEARRNGLPLSVAHESEIVLSTLSELYNFAKNAIAEIEVSGDGDRIALKFTMPTDGDEDVKMTYVFEKRIINPIRGGIASYKERR